MTLQEIKEALLGLPSSERNDLIAWMQDLGARDRVAEPVARYGPVPGPQYLSVEEYLEFEAASLIRHEYVAGEVFAMSGASLRHNAIATNLVVAFSNHLRGGPCKAFVADVKVRLRIGGDDIFYYPDVMVACGERNLEDRCLQDPKLLVEVLSPSTERIDRREKALSYREIATLEEYVLVAQDRHEVTLQRRSEDWRPAVLISLAATVDFRSIGLSMPLASIYEGVLASG